MEDPISSRVVVDTNVPCNLVFAFRKIDIIEHLSQCLGTTIEEIEDKEEEFMDNVQSESDKESPQLLD